MHYNWMLYEVFQQPGAYPYPFGSSSLGIFAYPPEKVYFSILQRTLA